jgi:two-component system chemotaxis response regulator CheY
MRNIQKRILAEIGTVEFVEAGDGIQALQVIGVTADGFQLILIDWNMPNMDGITLVNRIRTTDKKTPLVMVTTESEKSRIVEAIRAGVNNYILKPFTPEGMLEKIRLTLRIAA